MADTELRERQSWLEGAADQMSKRIEESRVEHKERMAFLEQLYISIDRKLWILIGLGIGTIVGLFSTIVTILLTK